MKKTIRTVLYNLLCLSFFNTATAQDPATLSELKLQNDMDLAVYYGKLVPQLGYDVAGDYFDEKYTKVIRTFSNDQQKAIRSPLSYLKTLNKVGAIVRQKILETHGIDLANLNKGKIFVIPNKDKINITIPFADLTLLEESSITDMVRIYIDTLYSELLKPASFEKPVFFAGFVPNQIANHFAGNHLFVDDAFYSGSIYHGKFPHLIQGALLVDQFGFTKSNMIKMIANGDWEPMFDSAHYYPVKIMAYDCLDKNAGLTATCSITPNEIINGHSAAIVSQWFMKNLFSEIISIASQSEAGASRFIDFNHLHDVNEYTGTTLLLSMYDNIRALENLHIIDLNNDIRSLQGSLNNESKTDASFMGKIYNLPNCFCQVSGICKPSNRFILLNTPLIRELMEVVAKTSNILPENYPVFSKQTHRVCMAKSTHHPLQSLATKTKDYYYNEFFLEKVISQIDTIRFFENRLRNSYIPFRKNWLKRQDEIKVITESDIFVIYQFLD
ncbi:hypothetical protein M3P05_00530 [Sansalvadorimonas sp. 2012CJ34-2]|uniref:Uncharacterized protein n=1 Tax=Parendozoicomonas callyspongiae TaxID=2942213 RepID=A0ABT0PAT8_9GAMM|nr:hypothetical protein [Sansalvadorimonas sp. 2012CJ34-2]MCL6268435.1 hypothetical protein [Sansalvadorimonas sp. 2012CJ34-2]